MTNGIIVPRIPNIDISLATYANLTVGSDKILELYGQVLGAGGDISNFIPSEYRPKRYVFNACTFINGNTYKMGYIIVRTNGNISGVIVDNDTYESAENYAVYGQVTWQ